MEWIKFDKATLTKPEVFRLAARLSLSRHTVIGLLCEFWSWADTHLIDGFACGVLPQQIDSLVGCPEFANSLSFVGWIELCEDGIRVPDFERHSDQSAKVRAQAAERKRRERQRNSVTLLSRVTRDKSVTREEKKREEKKKENGGHFLSSSDEAEPPEICIDPNFDWLTIQSDFIAAWNACGKTVKISHSQMPDVYFRKFRELWLDPIWRDASIKALERLEKVPSWRTEKLSLKTFLDPLEAANILAGNYDVRKPVSQSRNSRSFAAPSGGHTAETQSLPEFGPRQTTGPVS